MYPELLQVMFIKLLNPLRLLIIHYIILSILMFEVCLPCACQDISKSFVKISKNGHYFIDGDGNPFFWQGDTEAEQYGMMLVLGIYHARDNIVNK